jgi:hypothetical protein
VLLEGTIFISPYGLHRSVGEVLQAEVEDGNEEDQYAVAVRKSSVVVGHIPHEPSAELN